MECLVYSFPGLLASPSALMLHYDGRRWQLYSLPSQIWHLWKQGNVWLLMGFSSLQHLC